MSLSVLPTNSTVDRWAPFRELENLSAQMGRWMDSAFGRLDSSLSAWSPLADVSETDDAYVVEVELPGVRRDDVTIELVRTELVVSGEFKERQRHGLLRHRTRRVGRFRYQVSLPDAVDADNVEATLEDGMLSIRVPKSEAARPRRIAITGS